MSVFNALLTSVNPNRINDDAAALVITDLTNAIHSLALNTLERYIARPVQGIFNSLFSSLIQRVFPKFIVDLEDLPVHPTVALKNYFIATRERGSPPPVQFRQGGNLLPGQDEGGLTRDFITQIFNALRPKENGNSPLPLKEENGLYFPKIELPLQGGDVLNYRAIGMIYAMACNPQDPDLIKTGQFFHPAVFEMIHSLTDEELNWLFDSNPENPDSVRDQMPQAIYNKLFKIYLRNVYPNIFNTDDVINQFLNPPHILPPAWLGEAEGFDFNAFTSEFSTIIVPILIVARSMRDSGVDWAHMRENMSAEDLQKNIQGQVSAESMLEEIQGDLAPEHTQKRQKQEFLIQWIGEMPEEMLKKLCYAVSGSPYLHPLEITDVNPGNGPVFHTCFRNMDLPNYPNYETFKEAFTVAVNVAAQVGGFDLA